MEVAQGLGASYTSLYSYTISQFPFLDQPGEGVLADKLQVVPSPGGARTNVSFDLVSKALQFLESFANKTYVLGSRLRRN